MAYLNDTLTCPFCGDLLVLGSLPIVATVDPEGRTSGRARNFYNEARPPEVSEGGSERDAPANPLDEPLMQPSEPSSGRWKVVARAPLYGVVERGRLRKAFSGDEKLPPVTELAAAELRPARLCTSCEHPLPPVLDNRDYFTIGIVGINRSSKTHFLTALVQDIYYNDALGPLGCSEFEPDGKTDEIYRRDYYNQVYEHDTAALPTAVRLHRPSSFEPLVYRITLSTARPATLMFHDVAGEDLSKHDKRRQIAPFLSRADALIFIIDPRWLPGLRSKLTQGSDPAPNYEQMSVVSSVLHELEDVAAGGRAPIGIPAVIALSKVDLLRPLISDKHRFMSPAMRASKDEWFQDLQVVDDEIRELLSEYGGKPILRTAERLSKVSFCAMAPIGSQPEGEAIREMNPIRVTDPLVAVLRGIDYFRL